MALWSRLTGMSDRAARQRTRAQRSFTRPIRLEALEDRCLLTGTLWTQRGGDAGHTGYVDVSVDAAGITDAWNQPLTYVGTGTGSWAERAVAIDETHVYRTDLDGYAPSGTYHVIAYDLQTGAVVWNRSIIGNAFEGVGEPSVAGGIVYVNRAGHSGISGGTSADLPYLYGLSAATGTTVLQTSYGAQWASNERPVIRDNQLVAWDGYYGGFSAWTASTLSRQWNRTGSIYDPPLAALDATYVYAYGNQVYLRSNGARQADMTHPLGLTLTDAQVAGTGQLLYKVSGTVGGVQQFGIAAYDGTTHALQWTTYTASAVAGKAVGHGLVAVTAGQQLLLLDEASGSLIRTWQAPATLTGEIVLTRTHAFVETSANGVATVYAVNLASGQSEWSFQNTLQAEEWGGAYMEMAFGGGHLLLSHDKFVHAFAVSPGHPPDAVDDSAATDEDVAVTINVLANDSDPDGDALTVTAAGPAGHGSVKINADGTIRYTPAANYNGTDSFNYTISDGNGGQDTATVTLTIAPVNDAPIAMGWQHGTNEDTPLNDFLRASDAEGDPLTYSLVLAPANGTLQLDTATGTFIYTPALNYVGTDSFRFKVNDGVLDSNIAIVFVTVRAVNDAPTAQNDSYTTDEDTPLAVSAPGVLANDSDVEGSALTAVLVGGPGKGSLTLNSDGSFTYTPNANANGADSFTYRANDGALDSNLATVTITINAVNDAPTALNDSYSTDEDATLTVSAPGVLANDTDVDGDPLSAALVAGPTRGSLSLNADGSFTYIPDENVNGTDTFTYRAGDGTLQSAAATVTITINAVQDPPVANAGPDQSADEGSSVSFDGTGSHDVDGDSLTYSWTFGDGGASTGPAPRHVYADNGTYTVTLTVDDGHGNSDTDTLLVTVSNVAPTAGLSGPSSGVRGQARTFTFTASDISPVDQAGAFTYVINWGDGAAPQSLVGPATIQADHVFTGAGSFTVAVAVTDKDNGTSFPASRLIAISAVEMQGDTLVVGGTAPGADIIVIRPADAGGSLNVIINNMDQGQFAPPQQIVVYAQAGNDSVQLQSTKIRGKTTYVKANAFLYGDDGNDTLDARGSSADNVLLGGSGIDALLGGVGRDILLGGLGADTLRGGDDDDLLIGGTTDYDANRAALTALLNEWSRTDVGYQVRVNHLSGAAAGGLNGSSLLTAATVHDDAAIDQLFGEAGQDWFLYQATGPLADVLNDRKNNERATPI